MEETLILIYCLLAGAVCRRLTGGGIVDEGKRDPIPHLRRYGTPVLFGLLIYIIHPTLWTPFKAGLGYAIMDWVATGEVFSVLHGGYDGKRKFSIVNRWIHYFADKIAGPPRYRPFWDGSLISGEEIHNVKWGMVFTSLRGLYKLPLTLFFGSFWGVLGVFDSLIYFIYGRLAYIYRFKAERYAELTSGALAAYALYRSLF